MRTVLFYLIMVFYGTIQSLGAYPGEIMKQFPAPHTHCTGLAFDGKYLWVADHLSDKIYCLDSANGQVVREIPSPGFWPMGLAWDGKNLWNVDLKQKNIYKLNPEKGTILDVIESPTDHPDGLVWDGTALWVSDPKKNQIMKLDLSDGTALQSFPGPARSVDGLAFDGKYLWASDRTMDEIYMIRPQDGEVILVLKAPGKYPRGLAWDGQYLWNADYQSDTIYQLVRQDEDLYQLSNQRKARITYTHDVKTTGTGHLIDLEVVLAIPQDLPQQRLLATRFIPEKYQLVEDRWKQKYAQFQFRDQPSPAVIRNQMIVDAEISEITYFIFPEMCGTLTDIPADIRKMYTADGSKYQMQDPFIRDLSREIVGSEKNTYWMARKIFDYVRNTLEYHLEGGWNVAPFVLKRGTGSCSEYTFSFITLCRAAGIPARYVGAIVVRGDDASLDEVFHRWPEIYLPKYGWIPIDPQGGDKPVPRDRIMNIGHLSNRFLITTQGGGDSEYMGWYYNSHQRYTTDPQVQVHVENFGDWQPIP